MNATHRARALLIAISAALSPVPALCQADKEAHRELTIDDLKRIYLSCDRMAMRNRPSTASIAQCSVVYEVLKWRAFGGDLDKLLAWSRSQSLERVAEQ